MSKISVKVNPVTNLAEFNINGKLVSLSSSVRELKNAKKTKYRLATVKLSNGKTVTAQVWEKSAAELKVGQDYSCTGTIMPIRDGKQAILFNVAPFVGGETATLEDFADMLEAIPATPAGAQVVA